MGQPTGLSSLEVPGQRQVPKARRLPRVIGMASWRKPGLRGRIIYALLAAFFALVAELRGEIAPHPTGVEQA